MSKENQFIEVDGDKYPCHITLGAMHRFKIETGKESTEIQGIDDYMIWMWCRVKSASARTDRPLEMTCQEFLDCLEPAVLEKWAESLAEEAEGSKKKKVRKN